MALNLLKHNAKAAVVIHASSETHLLTESGTLIDVAVGRVRRREQRDLSKLHHATGNGVAAATVVLGVGWSSGCESGEAGKGEEGGECPHCED